ncbi:hypothetical protein [Hoeflea sp. 108]|jgi:hypothetical protein|uniref:hypothetical protein n=1 Tax=Hoeflea sp. 108 TaxID=1116369 RepID=UPI000365CF25|nr:hypothetical protein [Hoeflea sp. 108]
MTALILSALTNPTLLAIMGGLLAALVAFLKGNSRGARLERDRQAKAEQKAREEAGDIRNEVEAMQPDRVRAELGKRARP